MDLRAEDLVDGAAVVEQALPDERNGNDARDRRNIINDAERVGKLDVARHAHGEQNGQDHADGNTQKIEEGISTAKNCSHFWFKSYRKL